MKEMLKNVFGWLVINLFFIFFLCLFAGLAYVFLSFQKWITAGAPIEIQVFTVPIFGIAAVGITLWVMFKTIEYIESGKWQRK